MSQRNFIKMRGEIDSPFGEESIFYNVYDDPEGETYPDDETDEKDKYPYQIIPRTSGVEVFEKYASAEYKPTPKQILIFVEKKDSSTSNFFGTACRVKMGSERRALMWKLYYERVHISINDNENLARNLSEWAEDIAHYSKDKKTEIDKHVLLNALKLELNDKIDGNNILQNLLKLNDKLADWMRSGIEVMDTWKLKEENYEFGQYGRSLKPILPINFFQESKDWLYTGKRENKPIKDTGINHLTKLSDELDRVIFNRAYALVH